MSNVWTNSVLALLAQSKNTTDSMQFTVNLMWLLASYLDWDLLMSCKVKLLAHIYIQLHFNKGRFRQTGPVN